MRRSRTLTGMNGAHELLQRRTRSAFRDHCSDCGTVRLVERVFRDEGLDPEPWEERWDVDGQRRGVFDRCTSRIEWTDPVQVRLVLNALETIYGWGEGEWADGARERLRRHLSRDGYEVTDNGRIVGRTSQMLGEVDLAHLTDASAIQEHLGRVAAAADTDPAAAISGAKALIEATTKVVLTELNVEFDERADVPALVKMAQKALKLHPETLAPTATGAETVKRILSNLSQMAVGVAELRNEYGPDHGRVRAVVGLGPRHARLAVGCAITYCRLLLETLNVRRQP